MAVVARKNADIRHRIYHKCGCFHAGKIKPENRLQLTRVQAEKRGYRECKCCAGLQGDVRLQRNLFEAKKEVTITYLKQKNELYIATKIGFWKICVQRENGNYLLYHHNRYTSGMNIEEAIHGEFHRQTDVAGTTALGGLFEYIVAHDRAKVTIMDDYRKLPQRTRRQKHYYRVAERKNRRKALHRIDNLFATLERANEGMKRYSIC